MIEVMDTGDSGETEGQNADDNKNTGHPTAEQAAQ
jgi:hypothetical protein